MLKNVMKFSVFNIVNSPRRALYRCTKHRLGIDYGRYSVELHNVSFVFTQNKLYLSNLRTFVDFCTYSKIKLKGMILTLDFKTWFSALTEIEMKRRTCLLFPVLHSTTCFLVVWSPFLLLLLFFYQTDDDGADSMLKYPGLAYCPFNSNVLKGDPDVDWVTTPVFEPESQFQPVTNRTSFCLAVRMVDFIGLAAGLAAEKPHCRMEVNHPTSLSHGIPDILNGYLEHYTTNMLRFQKNEVFITTLATTLKPGVEARIKFTRDVKSSFFSCKVTKTNSLGYEVGTDFSVGVKGGVPEAMGALRQKLNISQQEADECELQITPIISDSCDYSELHCWNRVNDPSSMTVVPFMEPVSNAGKAGYEWSKNDLNLRISSRCASNNNAVFDVEFINPPMKK